MRVLALVTARGGSKGFPLKNIAPLAGRPLVAWSHRALAGLRSRRPGVVLRLSTDCPGIASAWPEADRPSDLRPSPLAGDTATSLSVVEYELERMSDRGEPCDAVLLVQPTSPLITTDDLESLWAGFDTSPAGSAALAATLDHPHAWSFRAGSKGCIEPIGVWGTARRQDETKGLRPVGCYMVSASFLREQGAFLVPEETTVVEIPCTRAVDIDEPLDLEIASASLRQGRSERRIELRSGHLAKTIGAGEPVFVIAEAGVNHNGDAELAEQLIDAAASAGADAVKFQTFDVASLVSRGADLAAYQRENLEGNASRVSSETPASQAQMLERLRLSNEALPRLKARAESQGLVFLSSPFDLVSAQVLRDMEIGAFKLGSGELTNLPFLSDLAAMGLPLLVSTGMGSLDEVEEAARAIGNAWPGSAEPSTAWLHCVSSYPAPPESSNLRAMDSLRLAVAGPVGMSDHSMGFAVTLAAVARGARVIEKHLTLDRSMEGPDHAASLEPYEFAQMMKQVRVVEASLGDGVKQPATCELDTMRAARRSLVAARDLPRGHVLQESDLVCKRPGSGLPPSMLEAVIGKRLTSAVCADDVLEAGDVDRDGVP